MKYIRTENGILKVDGYDNSGTCVIKTNTYAKTYYKEDYIKMTNTIEELCDYAAVWYRENDSPLFIHKSMLRDDRPSLQEQKANKEIYDFKLCILTNKGLIYVAKMNDKGDLELI